jgi:hypothetical protein
MNERVTAASLTHKNIGTVATVLLAERQCEQRRADAAECQEIATCRPDLMERHYEDLAHQWLLLAEQAERNRSCDCTTWIHSERVS